MNELMDDAPYSRDTLWMTQENQEIPVRDLSDTHLANLIDFLKKNPFHRYWPRRDEFIEILYQEIDLRGLQGQFVERAQIPYKDDKGNWRIWDFTVNASVILNKPERT